MKKKILMPARLFCVWLSLAILSAAALGKGELPKTTTDGLNLIESKKVDAVYWRDGETLAPYHRVMILDCHVSFEKNWQREYNRNQSHSENRVDADDLTRIGNELAAQFQKEFTKELQDKGGYEVVDAPADDVLLLRPSIVDLQISAPDQGTPGMSANFVTSAGAMTLYLELFDGATKSKIGLVVDARKDPSTSRLVRADNYSNRAAADRILRSWANILRQALDEAHEEK